MKRLAIIGALGGTMLAITSTAQAHVNVNIGIGYRASSTPSLHPSMRPHQCMSRRSRCMFPGLWSSPLRPFTPLLTGLDAMMMMMTTGASADGVGVATASTANTANTAGTDATTRR